MSLLQMGSFGKPYQELLSYFFPEAVVKKGFPMARLCKELVDECVSSELLAVRG